MFSHSRIATAALALSTSLLGGSALAAPTPVSSCQTLSQPGHYALDQNLAATGDCVIVDAPYVTLDLDGHAIVGNGPGAGIVAGPGAAAGGIAIRNGSVAGFGIGTGIQFHDTSQVRVENVRAIGNQFGIETGRGGTVRDCTVRGGRVGIRTGERGAILGNNVQGFSIFGISTGPGSNVADNAVGGYVPERALPFGAPGDASTTLSYKPPHQTLEEIEAGDLRLRSEDDDEDERRYTEIKSGKFGYDGIGIEAGAGSTVVRNSVYDAGSVGIGAEQGSTVAHNSVRDQTGAGIYAWCPSSVVDNTATNNGFSNVATTGGGCEVENNAQ